MYAVSTDFSTQLQQMAKIDKIDKNKNALCKTIQNAKKVVHMQY